MAKSKKNSKNKNNSNNKKIESNNRSAKIEEPKKMKKVGKIELLRFLFSGIIILFHCKNFFGPMFENESFVLFKNGSIGVEFFFIVSGWLMAKAALKPMQEGETLANSTSVFMRKKIVAILPAHIIAFTSTFIFVCVKYGVKGINALDKFILGLPNFLFLDRTGVETKNVIGAEWYISAMLIAMLILYPLCKKLKTTYTGIIAPVLGIFLLGYIFQKYKLYGTTGEWDVFCYREMLRAFGEISLGAFSCYLSTRISNMKFNVVDKILLTLIEFTGFAFTLLYTCANQRAKYGYICIIGLVVAVSLAFSGVTYGSKIFNNKVIYFLGSLSLPVYMIQTFSMSYVYHYCPNYTVTGKSMATLTMSIVLGIVILLISKPLVKLINMKISSVTESKK